MLKLVVFVLMVVILSLEASAVSACATGPSDFEPVVELPGTIR